MTEQMTGKGIDRLDARLKVMGKATYAAEFATANVAHAVIVGVGGGKGKLTALDTAGAEKAPGVITVLSHKNAPKLPGASKRLEGVDRVLQIFQDDLIYYSDQPIALVVADTLEHARYAASLVKPTVDAGTPVVSMEAERARAYPPKTLNGKPPDTNKGDFDVAFAGAKTRVEQTYTTPDEHHNPMEMHATIAVWQAEDKVTVYDATQGISTVQKKVATVFELKPEDVRVISHYVGGGFGCKGSPWSHIALAVMAAKVTQRPVKVMLTRQQMFGFVGNRPQTTQKVSLGADASGKLVAVRTDILSYTSQLDEFMEPAGLPSRMLYACNNIQTSHRLVKLDKSTPTFMRAPGEATGTYGLECAMDELAYALDVDPLKLRLDNYAETDPDENKPWSSKELRACYKQAADKFGWQKRKKQPRSTRDGHWLVGQGMATATYPANYRDSSAVARIKPDGTALVQSGTQDIGTGTYTIMTQIAADALGMPMDKVTFELGDTRFPPATGSGGSSTAASAGSAVKLACVAVRGQLIDLAIGNAASPLNGLTAADVDIDGGALVSKKDKTKRENIGDIVKRTGKDELSARADAKPGEARKAHSCHSFGAQFAEVRVDEATGEVRVSRVVAAFAAGKILNAKTARSQFLGGIVWGIGFALTEQTVRDARTGRAVNNSLQDYHVPVNADVPTIDVIMVDEKDPFVDEIGAKGIGEIGITGIGAAIANAVYHATGKRVRDLPITLDKLL
ncbi:MAG: xanthine dehydrogenase YagR molybdenum-binding subunit [Myxococcales bacterium]|nr:xanthine dehydrogenase YagR molybdenum-binding subunit [Myxococcales bacterium]